MKDQRKKLQTKKKNDPKQAGADLGQAQHSLSQLHTSLAQQSSSQLLLAYKANLSQLRLEPDASPYLDLP